MFDNEKMRKERIINNIKEEARISLMLNKFWDEIHEGIRDKEDVIKAISELLDEKEKPLTRINRRF